MRIITEKTYCDKCGKQLVEDSDEVWHLDLPVAVGTVMAMADYCPTCYDEMVKTFDHRISKAEFGKLQRLLPEYQSPAAKKAKSKMGYPYPGMKTAPVNAWKCACGKRFKTEQGLKAHTTRQRNAGFDSHEAAS